MLKRHLFLIGLGISLVLLSILIYFVHYLIFNDAQHIFMYLLDALAFLPLEVLLVVVVVERILNRREREMKLQKLNMVVGAFFSEVGNQLLRDLLGHFNNREEITSYLNVNENWTRQDFQNAAHFSKKLRIEVNLHSMDLPQLKSFLSEKREFLLTLLENPSLLENDRFTNLLWSVTHLSEELEARLSVPDLPDKDLGHLAGDIRRMYDHLASEWIMYAEHLKTKYPYLFSMVVRTHPFQNNPSPIFT